jgi:hypothetical protein
MQLIDSLLNALGLGHVFGGCPNAANTTPVATVAPGTKDIPAAQAVAAAHHGKVTICHATGSATNPFVTITISINGLHGHGKHADDVIPAPAGGCGVVGVAQSALAATTPTTPGTDVSPVVAPADTTTPGATTVTPADAAAGQPAVAAATASPGASAVDAAASPADADAVGASGTDAASGAAGDDATPVLAANASVDDNLGPLPFTGMQLGAALALALLALIVGGLVWRHGHRRTSRVTVTR